MMIAPTPQLTSLDAEQSVEPLADVVRTAILDNLFRADSPFSDLTYDNSPGRAVNFPLRLDGEEINVTIQQGIPERQGYGKWDGYSISIGSQFFYGTVFEVYYDSHDGVAVMREDTSQPDGYQPEQAIIADQILRAINEVYNTATFESRTAREILERTPYSARAA